jgi:hypothetical protein
MTISSVFSENPPFCQTGLYCDSSFFSHSSEKLKRVSN